MNLELVLQFTALVEDKCLDSNLPTEITLRLKKCPFPTTRTEEIQDRLKRQRQLAVFHNDKEFYEELNTR